MQQVIGLIKCNLIRLYLLFLLLKLPLEKRKLFL
jgi:hypothetical protein